MSERFENVRETYTKKLEEFDEVERKILLIDEQLKKIHEELDQTMEFEEQSIFNEDEVVIDYPDKTQSLQVK